MNSNKLKDHHRSFSSKLTTLERGKMYLSIQTPSTGLRHPSLEEGAGKRCSECALDLHVAITHFPRRPNQPTPPITHLASMMSFELGDPSFHRTVQSLTFHDDPDELGDPSFHTIVQSLTFHDDPDELGDPSFHRPVQSPTFHDDPDELGDLSKTSLMSCETSLRLA